MLRFPDSSNSLKRLNGASAVLRGQQGNGQRLSIPLPHPDPADSSSPPVNDLERDYQRRAVNGRLVRVNYAALNANDLFGFGKALRELGKFNAAYVPPFMQDLMRRSVYPRLALQILRAALSQRQYVVEGDDPRFEAFHQRWVDRLLPAILRKASNAIWFGWQPFVIDWDQSWVEGQGVWEPGRVNDLDPFATTALRDPESGRYIGLMTDDGRWGLSRSFWMTWDEEQGDPYGYPQSYTCYPYWWAASVTLVWMMRYYERSVDPVRLGFARNIAVFTGKLNDDGSKQRVDLTEMIAEALDAASGGDSLAVPMGVDDNGNPSDLVKIDTLELPDRADTWQKLLTLLEQRQFLATLGLPGIGVSTGESTFAEGRITMQTQLSLLEYASDMPLAALNEHLIPAVHAANGFPGRPPRARGKAFKREQEESLHKILQDALTEEIPEVKNGEPTGRVTRMVDMIRPDWLLKSLDIAAYDIGEVSRERSETPSFGSQDKGGRPVDPYSERADDRRAGLRR